MKELGDARHIGVVKQTHLGFLTCRKTTTLSELTGGASEGMVALVTDSTMLSDYLPILLQTLIVMGFAGVTLGLSVLLGRTGKRNATKDSAYECGMLPIGEAQPRFSVKFYLIAMLFVLFDIEVVFLYPWAVVFDELALFGFIEMMVFLAILLVGYLYAWRRGALEWA